jgi:HSF-type DNA-binding
MYGESPLLQWETTRDGEPPSNNIIFTEPNRFASQVLPEFAFPTTSFNSLVRKMYRWGFRRAVVIDQTPAGGESGPKAFCCDKFRRGDFSLLMQMFSTDSRPKKGRAQPAMKATMIPSNEMSADPSLEIRLARDSVPEQRYKRQKTSSTAQSSSSSSLAQKRDSPRPEETSSAEGGDKGSDAEQPIQRPNTQRSMELAMGSAPLLPPLGLPAPLRLNPSLSRQLELRSLMSRQCIEENMLRATLQQLRETSGRGFLANRATNSMLTVSHPLPGELNIRISFPTVTNNLPLLPNLQQLLQSGLIPNANIPAAADFSRQRLVEQPRLADPARSLLHANPVGSTLPAPSAGPNRSIPPFLNTSRIGGLDPEQLMALMRARQSE